MITVPKRIFMSAFNYYAISTLWCIISMFTMDYRHGCHGRCSQLKLLYLNVNTVWDHLLLKETSNYLSLICLTIKWVLLPVVVVQHALFSPLQEYTMNLYMTDVDTEYDQTESKRSRSWYDPHFFSLLEFHTDKSTNCTLLGPVDCDSFYKWIPLNRWPVAISSEVLHFTYCISILIHVHLVVLCLFASLGAGSEVWVWRKSGGLCRRAGLCGRKDSHWSRQIHSLFIDFSHTHTHWHAHYQVFFLIIINIF